MHAINVYFCESVYKFSIFCNNSIVSVLEGEEKIVSRTVHEVFNE